MGVAATSSLFLSPLYFYFSMYVVFRVLRLTKPLFPRWCEVGRSAVQKKRSAVVGFCVLTMCRDAGQSVVLGGWFEVDTTCHESQQFN